MTDDEGGQGAHKKRRTQGACDNCRSRKIKCDSANRPGNLCSNCVSFKTECTHVFAMAKKKRGPPKGTPRGQRTIQSIVNSLLSSGKPYEVPDDPSAVKKLLVDLALHIKGQDEEIASLKQGPSSSPSNLAPSEFFMSPEISSSPPPGSYLDVDAHALESLREHMENLGIDHANNRHFGNSSSIMLVKTAMDIKKEYTGDHEPQSFSSGSKRPEFWTIQPWQIIPTEEPTPFVFPDDDLLSELVQLYLINIDRYLPLFHQPSFLRSISEGLHREDRHFGAVVLAVCAVGARFSTDPRIYEDSTNSEQSIGWKWVRQVQPIKRTFTAPPCVYEIQLFAVFVLFMQSTTTPEYCWIFISIGIRLAQDVGAHRKRPSGVRRTLESEVWARAFWMLYIMDLFMSAFLGRPRSIAVEDIDVSLPVDCDDEYWEHEDPALAFQQPPEKPSRMAYWLCHISLLEILGQAIKTIYSVRRSDMWTAAGMSSLQWSEKVVAELDSTLNKWIDQVPEHLKWDPNREDTEHFKQSVMLHTTYYWIQIQIHRPFIPRPGEGAVLSFPSLAICANAARSCFRVMEVQQRRNTAMVVMPNVMMAMFNAAIVLLVNVWRGRRLKALSSIEPSKEFGDVYQCIAMLRLHENRWLTAGRFTDILMEVISVSHLHHEKGSDSGLKRQRDTPNDDTSPPPNSESPESEPRPIAGTHRVSVALNNSLKSDQSSGSQTPPSEPERFSSAGSESSSEFDSLSMNASSLPMHSSELGSLPVYESFDWPMNQWPFTFTGSASGSTSDSSWTPKTNPNPDINLNINHTLGTHAGDANLMLPQQSQSHPGSESSASVDFGSGSISQNLISLYSEGLSSALGSGAGMYDVGNDRNIPMDPHSVINPMLVNHNNVYDQHNQSVGLGGGGFGTSSQNDSSASSWDDWGTYMASLDEVLQGMNPRL